MTKPFTLDKIARGIVAAVLVVVPFHAFLTVWAASLFGHYTLWRLWDDVLLVCLVGIVVAWLVRDASLRTWFGRSLLVRLIAAYIALTCLLGLISWLKSDVTPKALAYGILVNLRIFVWFLAVLMTAQRSPWLHRNWPKLLLVPAVVVMVFAVLQYTLLPHDFLTHFGYNAATTIAPIETIDHNNHYIRVQSTLRGANPLGAYLVIIATAFGALYWRTRHRLMYVLGGFMAVFALYASGSRSAWIGALVSLAIVGWLLLPTRHLRVHAAAMAAGLVIILAALFVAFRNNAGIENAFLHTQHHSTSSVSSNAAHASALKAGLGDVVRQPFGDGPGTAGPASTYNTGHPVRIAEDYYVQVAQETGWLGLALLLAIFALVAWELQRKAATSRLTCIAFASFVGLLVVNALSHAWSDDTLAYVWWGMAGIALGSPLPRPPRKSREV